MLWLIMGLALLNFAVGCLWHGQPPVAMLLASVALAVSAIPEGLPAALTVTLAIGVARMAKRRAIIRKLPAVETLGGVTVICSDKTGTITENQMTVTEICTLSGTYRVTGGGYAPEGRVYPSNEDLDAVDLSEDIALERCLRAGVLCNDSDLVEKGGRWQVEGDPTEGALLVAARKAGFQIDELRGERPRLDVIPFDSNRRLMATVHQVPGEAQPVVFVKGRSNRSWFIAEMPMTVKVMSFPWIAWQLFSRQKVWLIKVSGYWPSREGGCRKVPRKLMKKIFLAS